MTLTGHRKFIVTVIAQSYITGLCAFGLITGSDALTAILGVSGAFITLNVIQNTGARP